MKTKLCPRCRIIKPIADYSKASREKDGLQTYCKSCNKEISAKYRANNVEKEQLRHAKYHFENKEQINARISQWQKENKDKCREASKRFYHSHKESEKIRMKNWENLNPNWKKNYAIQWRLNNSEHRKAYDSWYQKQYKDKVNAKNARRKATLLKATPLWANFDNISAIYLEARLITEQTGIEHHVDHIVPLRSKLVCGLHCEANLQILRFDENVKKGNRFWPDMP